jgi:D-aminopeptidase
MNKIQQQLDMYGMLASEIDDEMRSANEPLMGGLPMMVMSILSNVQEEIAIGYHERARQNINVCKYILSDVMKREMNNDE